MPNADIKQLLNKLADGHMLDERETVEALDMLMADDATVAQRAAFLMGLRMRGESVEEISGAAMMLRAHMTPVSAPKDAVDIVGTGGDAHGTYNVSTCAAIVAAAAGLKVAKHGNRSVSSKSGASDVLAALGVKLDINPKTVARAIDEANVGFMWAPMHHPAMKNWAPVRAELGLRTIFNLVGPLANPARVTRQVVGVYDKKLVEPIAHVLKNLGSEHAWVVHGADGMDELTTTGSSFVAELVDGAITVFEISPADAGLETSTLEDLQGGDATVNAKAITGVLAGEHNPFRDIVLLNAASALIVGGKVANLAEGAARAAKAIDSGTAAKTLETLVSVTNA